MKRLAVGLAVLCLGGLALSNLLQTGGTPALEPQAQQPVQGPSETPAAVLQAPAGVLAPVKRSVAERESGAVAGAEPESEGAEDDLFVLALNADGKPVANVPIDLVVASELTEGLYRSQKQEWTGADGVACFKRQRRQLKQVLEPGADAPFKMAINMGMRCALLPAQGRSFPGSEGVVRILEVPRAGELLRIGVPPVGWLRVNVVGASGERGLLVLPDGISWRKVTTSEQPRMNRYQTFDEGRGSFLLGPFGLGWKLGLMLNLQSRTGKLATADVDGPLVAGETCEVTVEVPKSLTIKGVALDAQEEPLGARILILSNWYETRHRAQEQRVITDSAGAWEVQVPPDIDVRKLTLGLHRDPRESTAEVDLSPLVDAQVDQLDVGAVVLRPTKGPGQVLASGTVVGGDGQGIEGVDVGVYALGTAPGGSDSMATTRTDSAGAFEVLTYDPIEVAKIIVHASKRGYLRPAQEIRPPGMVGLRLRLEQGASLAGKILLDGAVIRTDRIALRLKGEGVSRKPSHMDFVARYKGEFVGLKAGSYQLTVEISGTKWVLFDEEFTLVSGERLDFGSIDLRGKVRVLQLKLVDPGGEPIRENGFALHADDRKGKSSIRSSSEGLMIQLVPSKVKSMWLRHKDFGEYRFNVGDGLIELTLTR